MPLIKSKSKKAFEHNVESEMEANPGKDNRAQNLAIAYSVKRKAARKKMAEGGMAYKNDSAKTQSRPMPQERDNDSVMVSHNDIKKALIDSNALDQPTVRQAQRPSMTKLSRPKMVETNAFSVKLRDQEDDLMKMQPSSPKAHPESQYNEEDPRREGPAISDMQDEHSTEREPYAEGGSIEQYEDAMDNIDHDEHTMDNEMQPMDEEDDEHHSSIAAAIMAKKARMYAEGGEVDLSRNADEDPNEEDQLSYDALRKENYSESEGLDELDSPMDSNKHSDSEELDAENKHDRISQIRARMKSMRR